MTESTPPPNAPDIPPASPPPTSRSHVMWRFVRILVLAYVGVAIMMYSFQASLIFPGGGEVRGEPDGAYEDIRVDVGGETTHGWYVPNEKNRGTVLVSHGNGENVLSALMHAEPFREQGFNVLVYDYGGYGYSSGAPSEQRCYADIRAMWSWLTETKGIAPETIVLFGRSLGGGVTTQLATEVEPGAVILESTFTSVPDVARKNFWFLPLNLLVQHRFDNAKKIGDIHAPLLVIHSPDDTLIPYSQGEALFEAAHEPKRFLEISGGHNGGAEESGTVYTGGLASFLDPLFPVAK